MSGYVCIVHCIDYLYSDVVTAANLARFLHFCKLDEPVKIGYSTMTATSSSDAVIVLHPIVTPSSRLQKYKEGFLVCCSKKVSTCQAYGMNTIDSNVLGGACLKICHPIACLLWRETCPEGCSSL